MTNEPFRPEDVLYRFTPKGAERAGFRAEEYALVRDPESIIFGFAMWVRYQERWQIGYHGERVIIRQLLIDLAALTEERDGCWRALEQLADGKSWVTLRPRKETEGGEK